jgi:hypothetical protein
MAGVPGRSGGARPGSGPKRKSDRYAEEITGFNDLIAEELPHIPERLIALANGGVEVVSEKWQPACTVMIESQEIGDEGKVRKTKVQAFPDLPPEEMVLVERRVDIRPPDLAANLALADRITGRPGSEDVSALVDAEVEAFRDLVLAELEEVDQEIVARILKALSREKAG